MSEPTQHRPPAPPQPNTVHAEPATPEAAAADYAGRADTTTPETISAAPHTHGRGN